MITLTVNYFKKKVEVLAVFDGGDFCGWAEISGRAMSWLGHLTAPVFSMTSRLKKTTVFQVVFDNNIGDSIKDELKLHFLFRFVDEK